MTDSFPLDLFQTSTPLLEVVGRLCLAILFGGATAGVAFLAAGTIIQSRGSVQDLTTGASMRLAGAVGVACGGGFYPIAFIGTVLALIVLFVLGKLEAYLVSTGDDD